MAPPPDWLAYVQMSEAFPAVKPWEWLQVCEFWPDKIEMYLKAQSELEEARAANERLRNQPTAQ